MSVPIRVLLVVLLGLAGVSQAQVIIGQEKTLNGPSHRTITGKVRTLFWKATIDQQVAFVSLADVETFGLQEYAVDNAAYVRELTISLKSRNLVRIYHVEPRNSPSGYLNDTVENFTERLSDVQAAALGDKGQRVNAVIKSYPVTTHKEMVEYRVSKKQTIADLYAHLEKAYLDYHATEVVEGQRAQTISEVKVEE
ncbi:hypothetical protein [Rubritalea tangerina]|uniref:Uncharacterized protein n=1 Tax=Rubritalea tangerina TaxID=430798 RepID=A0ABW4ZAH8_9BACT